MIKSEDNIVVGRVFYDRHTYRMGNTPIRALGEWTVEIVEVRDNGALVRWNGNRPEFWDSTRLRRLYTWSMRDPGVVVTKRNMFGAPLAVRRETKAERAAREAVAR